MTQMPQLDIRELSYDQDAFVRAFGAAYEEWGFAGLTGHGIDLNLTRQAMRLAADFFALDVQRKMNYVGDCGYERGYIPFGVESAKNSRHADLKEFFHIGREVESIAHLGKNIWPTEILGFKDNFAMLFNQLDQLAHLALSVFALHLGLNEDYFNSKVAHGEALLRILHYPPIEDESVPNVRAAAHEDINLLTLLVGSQQSGLEILRRDGTWIPISTIEGTIICNVGDMLERLSNGTLPSTTHRVVNPLGQAAKQSRYSMPFFMHPSPEVRLDVLPECVSDDYPIQYPPISAGEFLQQRLEAIGLVKT